MKQQYEVQSNGKGFLVVNLRTGATQSWWATSKAAQHVARMLNKLNYALAVTASGC